MARIEKGPATRNRSREWNPDDVRWPITERDRRDAHERDGRDARFRNATSKPSHRGDAVDDDGQPVFDGKPRFDHGRFKTGQRLDYTDYRLPDYEEREDGRLAVVERDTNTGRAVPAVCEGASCGADANAKSTAKFGWTSSGRLNREARRPLNLVAATVPGAPLYFGRIAAAAIMKHKLFRNQKIKRDDGSVFIHHTLLVRHNGHLLPHIGFRCWFGKNYPWRWDQPASCYVDIRIDGKATNSADLTWSQAATGIADEASDNLSTRPRRHEGRKCPLIFYEKPVLCVFLLWLMAALDAYGFWSMRSMEDFCLFAAEPPSSESVHPQYHEWCQRVAEAHRHYRRPTPITERDKVIASHWPLAANRCRTVPKAHRADAIQACMERIITAYDAWKPELGSFGTFAEQAIEWAIQDFMKEQRKQVPVQRSINLNDPAVNANDDDDDDDDNTPPEQPNMLKPLNALQGQANEAKRRLVAERLDCLDLRQGR
jgi:RNA polymerase sigma factor (sigma-70 family)